MRIAPIPDSAVWEGGVRKVIGPPQGHDATGDVRPLEAVVDVSTLGPCYSIMCVLEPGDLERLTAGEPVWLTMFGGVAPISVAVGEPGVAR